MKNLHILQQESIDEGRLQVRVRQKNMGTPVADARVSVSYSGDPQGKIEETDTNESGSIEAVEIATPPLEYSMSPSESQPYSEVTVTVSANGYRNITVSGVEVMPDRLSIQDIELEVLDAPGNDVDNIVIPAHTLYGDYPAKIPEPEIMPVAETGEIVLNRVVIPEYVIVHDGAPSDSTAANYYVRYKDYIKNVASSEIYATWPDATIRANVLAIMSFTLNRIYTEFYRGKGYNFNSLFYFLISKEIKLQIKVCLLFAVSRNLPLRLLIKIWKICIRIILEVHLCDVGYIAFIHELLINFLSTNDINIL